MTAVLLSVHVIAAIVFIGPVTVATSLFPRYAREGNTAVVDALHRISRVYAVLGVSVPAFGLATGAAMGMLGDAWLIASILLTAGAAALLALVVLPGQSRVVAALHADGTTAASPRLAMASGVFALTWAAVVVLMIVRPGSTTGV
ncbi:hypothetical protein I4I73_22165 [Pseudonocardia sp. KRD-184]|uniref:Integral membrane protein DUF2269 n=1 Tax=Pseudonocardia oceani TaxID=2792013 RepID=A0ABS6UEG9_9PSEU|nr:hypothetical protein [Pseudonocardia oceani]MBW0089396.1 hypothetical protein [Pseudonocardia oceani]MBW0098697.1 hypothetical protein [Pseudonocardia oceani]MBW0107756.1 hypothetical protein [Pseudonocardia oceani]MBW0123299.1 hypothetical protein [Pseudonocardia oceani]MBW0130333.1 hypothetical protein [Pseudonocardia oceani]